MTKETIEVVVTGAASGIGAAITSRLQDQGWLVVGVDRSASSAADTHLQLDLQDPAAMEAVSEVVGNRPLAGLVNSAGVGSTKPSDEVTAGDWDRILAVNLRAPFLLAERLVDRLSDAEGSVVNVASVHAYATSPGAVPYAASKGGLLALTRGQAIDWAARGLTVRSNAVAPGAVDTPMLREAVRRTGVSLDQIAQGHPSGRIGTPGDIAAAVAWLLSPESSFVNAAVLLADGGALAQLSTEPTSFGLRSHGPA